MLPATGAKANVPALKNRARAANPVVLPPSEAVVDEMQPSPRPVRASGVVSPHLGRLALIAASVDPDGCMRAPLDPSEDERATVDLESLQSALVRAGVAVTLLQPAVVGRAEAAEQRRVQAIKGAFELSYGQDFGRWFATKAEPVASAKIDPGADAHRRAPHVALAAMLTALHVDAVLAVDDLTTRMQGRAGT